MPEVLTRVDEGEQIARPKTESAACNCTCHSLLSSRLYCEHCEGDNEPCRRYREKIKVEHERLRAAVVEAAKAYGLAARAVEDHMKKSNDADDDSAAGWQLLRDMESKQEDLLLESVWPLIAFEAEHKIGEAK
jgi:hypothetical protein